LFHDPDLFLALRGEVLPLLRTFPSIRVWIVGAGGGEDAYATAIVLREEGLESRAMVYATDTDAAALGRAREGIFAPGAFDSERYVAAGGKSSLGEYFALSGDHAVLRPALAERIVFAEHNLATDASFNEFHLILCRSVLDDADRALRRRAFAVIDASVVRFGTVALDRDDSLGLFPAPGDYAKLAGGQRLFQRRR
jgi:chemotaxis protein methyltransferase CheR